MNINTNNPQTIADLAYVAIALNTKKFIKYETAVLLNKDPEDLHQMRVGLRRLRSVIVGFQPVLEIPQICNQKNIGKIAQTLSKKRDLDILTDHIKEEYYHNLPEEEKTITDQLINTLEKEKKEQLILIKETLTSKKYQKIKQSLKKWLDTPKFSLVGNQPIEKISLNLILPQVSTFLVAQGWYIGLETLKNKEQELILDHHLSGKKVNLLLKKNETIFHQLRKEAKKTRYQMEFFSNVYGQKYQEYLEFVTIVQDNLGDIQDIMVLIATLKKIIGKKWSTKLPTFTRLITENQYQQWLIWQNQQKLYLQQTNQPDFLLKTFSTNVSPHQAKSSPNLSSPPSTDSD